MKKNLVIILALVIVIVGGIFFIRFGIGGDEDTWLCQNGQWVKHGNPSAAQPILGCGADQSAVDSFDNCLSAGNPVMESYPRQCRTTDGRSFTEYIGNELEKMDLIRLDSPRPNQTIASPLAITGEARGYWFFEASFPARLVDGNGTVIATGIATAQDEWMTEDFVPFTATLNYAPPATARGELILEKDNPSGLPENADELRIPMVFDLNQEFMTVKVFFGTPETGNEPDFDCQQVAAVDRVVPKTTAVARAALEALLAGPTAAEQNDGYVTSINGGVRIQQLTIAGGVATVDFDQQLEYAVGGSCRVAAIRAQIIETLKQFPTVNSVVISIDGRTEDILQP